MFETQLWPNSHGQNFNFTARIQETSLPVEPTRFRTRRESRDKSSSITVHGSPRNRTRQESRRQVFKLNRAPQLRPRYRTRQASRSSSSSRAVHGSSVHGAWRESRIQLRPCLESKIHHPVAPCTVAPYTVLYTARIQEFIFKWSRERQLCPRCCTRQESKRQAFHGTVQGGSSSPRKGNLIHSQPTVHGAVRGTAHGQRSR